MHGRCCKRIPKTRLLFGLGMLAYLVSALCLTYKLVKALETMALAKTMGQMGDRLTDIERADLEARIRENIFPA